MRLVVLSALAALFALVTAAGPAAADTIVPAGFVANQTWTAAGSPYRVQGTIQIAAPVTLRMEPGTVVEMAAGSSIVVMGTLDIVGTASDPVSIAGPPTAGSWIGIDSSGTNHLRLDHVTIDYARWAVQYGTFSASTFESTGLTVRHTERAGVRVTGTATVVLDRFTSLDTGGYAVQLNGASATVTNCLVGGGTTMSSVFGTGGLVLGAGGGAQPSGAFTLRVVNCTIDSVLGTAISAIAFDSLSTARLEVIDTLITHNQAGVSAVGSSGGTATSTIEHSDVWGNSVDYLGLASAGAGTISQDPRYAAAGLRLRADSPCIDRGIDGGAPDRDLDGRVRPVDGDGDGTAVIDLGAFEYLPVPTTCGDGVVQPGELCDAAAANGDYEGACNATCDGPGPRCGDAIANGPEACDDGNDVETDDCLTMCRLPTCGDGIVHMFVETCDAGAHNGEYGVCNATCTGRDRCGDAVVNGPEPCDDGNAEDTDGCLVGCTAARCGDGAVQTGVEACDDANAIETDGCRADCTAARCGDGAVQTGVEACDDGNLAPGDGCDASCAIEPPPDEEDEPAGGCCSTGGTAPGASGLLVLATGLALMRRRRRATSPSTP